VIVKYIKNDEETIKRNGDTNYLQLSEEAKSLTEKKERRVYEPAELELY